jgi:hypothetical protein
MNALCAQLDAIEQSIDGGTYRAGTWQRFLEQAARATPEERRSLEEAVTRVSEKLHARKGGRRLTAPRGLAFESLATVLGLLVLAGGAASERASLVAVAAVVLGTALQPLLKTSTGIALGMDYAYAYLWRGEPRFKLRFGSYLAAPRWRRVVLHLSGTLGTPIATALCSAVATPSQPMLGRVLAWLAALHLLFQAAILVLAGAGVHRMPLLGILRLTSAGAAGFELRGALRSRAVR